MRIQPIVEGHGEIDALPVLLRRLQDEAQSYSVDFGHPIRQRRSQLVQPQALQRAVKLALKQPECCAVLVVFDADDDCPKELARELEGSASEAAGDVPCALVIANREYEAWFLASVESLRRKRSVRADATFDGLPEETRDAKGALERLMDQGASYLETTDQAALSAEFDLGTAYARSRSFRKLTTSFGGLLRALRIDLPAWPPPAWVAQSQ